MHQSESMELQLKNRRSTLTQGSSQSEVLNVLGPLQTIEKMNENNNNNKVKQLKD